MFLTFQLGGLGSHKGQTFRAQVLPVSDTHGSILQWESNEERKHCTMASEWGGEQGDPDSISVTST